MKYLKLYEYAKNESLVDKKIRLIKDLSYDLTDDGFTVDVYKGERWFDVDEKNIPAITRHSMYPTLIHVVITFKKYHYYWYNSKTIFNNFIKEPKISIEDFTERSNDFVEDLKSYNLNIRSISTGDWFCTIDIYKHGKTSDFIRNY